MRKISAFTFLFITVTLSICFVVHAAKAQSALTIEINPHLIDEKVKASDILKYQIKLKNLGDRKAFLFAGVNDLSPEGGLEPFESPELLDKKTSVARWIKFSRGQIELMPGEEKEMPLEIDVNLDATPGKRHAAISLSEGNNRPEALGNIGRATLAQLLINLDVIEETVEKAEIKVYKTNKNFFFELPAKFEVSVKNIGNVSAAPHGYIYIYNRRGEEVEKISINTDSKSILPETVLDFPVEWNSNKGMGKFRARLELEYGENNAKQLQDTIYFWIMPWKFIAIIGASLFILLVILAVIIFKSTFKHSTKTKPTGVIDLR